MKQTKALFIPKGLFMQAYRLVKANAGGSGVDNQSITMFEENLKDNLYKLWNRMSSGSYFPPAVKAVPIPKKTGGERILGIPTVSDRIAQMVVKLVFEPKIEPHFLTDSYGYRPNKSAIEAVGVTRQRCWQYDWVLEFDIKGLFDNIPHELLMKAVRKHTECKWTLIYIERWLTAPMQLADGSVIQRASGVPQGGVVSPCLSNLFLHYVFDSWVLRTYPNTPWCRYADDGLLHCNTEEQALELLEKVDRRFTECGLQMHPNKTKIVYCKDGRRKNVYPNTWFDFLGFRFQARSNKAQYGNKKCFTGFAPAVSPNALKSMRDSLKEMKLRKRTDLSLEDIARLINPKLRGWFNYYGQYYRTALKPLWFYVNQMLIAWARRKYQHLSAKVNASTYLVRMTVKQPGLFFHWQKGMDNVFV